MSDTTSAVPAGESTPDPNPSAAVPAEAADARAATDLTPAETTPRVAESASSGAPATELSPAAAAAKRARRGARVAGAIGLPLVAFGLVLLAFPLAVWYLSTIIRTIVVVVANAVSGGRAADDANSTLARIDPDALSTFTVAFAIVGAVLLVAGWLVSFFVLRAHAVQHPAKVTWFAIPVGVFLSTVVAASIGALTGLLFGSSETVADILATAALGIALTIIGSLAAAVATGAIVWPWMAAVFRDRQQRAEAAAGSDAA